MLEIDSMQITSQKLIAPRRPQGTPQKLTELYSEPMDPKVSADGSTVVFASGTTQPLIRETYTVGTDGENLRRLTDRQVNLSWQPSISPDGKKIAYVVEKQGRSDLQVMNLDGSGNTNITDNNKGYWSPAWSPDGKTIVTVSRDTERGNVELVAVAADGGSKVQLTKNGLYPDVPVFTPDGQNIVFSVAPGFGPALLASIKSDGTGFRAYATHLTLAGTPAVTPDNCAVFGASDQNGEYGLYEQKLESDLPPRLLHRGKNIFSPAVSPDGTRIVFSASVGRDSQLFEIDRRGENLSQLTTENSNSSPVYTPDGKSIVYLSSVNWDREIYRIDLQEQSS